MEQYRQIDSDTPARALDDAGFFRNPENSPFSTDHTTDNTSP
jgi:hypothetical protein